MRFRSAELEDGDLSLDEVDFAANESMWPGGIEGECASQQGERGVADRR